MDIDNEKNVPEEEMEDAAEGIANDGTASGEAGDDVNAGNEADPRADGGDDGSGESGQEDDGPGEGAEENADPGEGAEEDAGFGENGGKGDGSDGKEQKKKFFGRKEKKDPKDEKIDELTDKNQRLMAEFQNFRTRSEKEKSAMYEVGAKSVIEKILPVVDNFERAFSTISDEDRESAVGQGLDMIYKQFKTLLSDLGVTEIEAVGKEFDPNLHNAVMHVEDEGAGENVVVEEFQKGYMYRDSVIRHSMVKVAN